MLERPNIPNETRVPLYSIELSWAFARLLPDSDTTDASWVYNDGRVYLQIGKERHKVASYFKRKGGFIEDSTLSIAEQGKRLAENILRQVVVYAIKYDQSTYALEFRPDIETAYYEVAEDGLSSCMTHSSSDYKPGYTPVRFYSWEVNRRVNVAVLRHKESNRLVARTLVDLREGTYTRLYYVTREVREVLATKLEMAGFEGEQALTGCEFHVHFRKVNDKKMIIVPYLDRGFLHYSPTRKTIIIGNGVTTGDEFLLNTTTTVGMVPAVEQLKCACCEGMMEAAYFQPGPFGGEYEERHVCNTCRQQNFVFVERESTWWHQSEAVWSVAHEDYIPIDQAVYSYHLHTHLWAHEVEEVRIYVIPSSTQVAAERRMNQRHRPTQTVVVPRGYEFPAGQRVPDALDHLARLGECFAAGTDERAA